MSRKDNIEVRYHPPKSKDLSSVLLCFEKLVKFVGEDAAERDYAKPIIIDNESVAGSFEHE